MLNKNSVVLQLALFSKTAKSFQNISYNIFYQFYEYTENWNSMISKNAKKFLSLKRETFNGFS